MPRAEAIPAPGFLFVRHGETDWNAEGRLQGRRDITLNALGCRQAAEAGGRLAVLLRDHGVSLAGTRFVASPLGRTRDTMTIARAAMGLPCDGYALDDRLQEVSFGAWEGSTWPEIKARDPALLKQRRRDKWTFVPPGGESYAMLAERLRPWLASVIEGTVVVSHGGVARALMMLIGGVSRQAAPDAEILQGRVLRFDRGRTAWV